MPAHHSLTAAERATSRHGAVFTEPYPAPLSLRCYFPDTPGRAQLEELVRKVFFDTYGADISSFCDCLLGLRDGTRLLGVVGVRPGHAGPFFLQQYLDEPALDCVQRVTGTTCGGAELVEIGNLAVPAPGASRLLLTGLAAFLHGAGARWMMFTAVAPLIHLLGRAGFRPHQLAAAERERLRAGADKWGCYYQRSARVCVGSIHGAAHALKRGQGAVDGNAGKLWDEAWFQGSAARPWFTGHPWSPATAS